MSSLVKIVSLIIGTFLFAAFALGAEVQLNAKDYNIYKGDLDGDGDSDFYFSQKPLFIILHGDIATPIQISGNKNYAVYNTAGVYADAALFSISSELLASRIAAKLYKFAVWNVDVFMGLDGKSVSVPNSNASSGGASITTAFAYDALGRLTFVTDSVAGNRDYDYDAAGNRLLVSTSTTADEVTEPTFPKPTGLSYGTHWGNGYDVRWVPVAGATYYRITFGSQTNYTIQGGSSTQFSTGANTSADRPNFIIACNATICSSKAYF